jgi:GT2 family glycosyltransferase
MADSPLITACIITYNSEKHIENVLASLFQSTVINRMEITVVDNASTDRTAALVEASYPGVRLIKLPQNIGFGQGHNKALPYMNAPYHLIVNPDITMEPDVLERMTAFMDTRADVALLTPKVLHPDGSEQFLPKELPSIHFLLGGYLERLGRPFTSWRSRYTWRDREVTEPVELFFATGCFMLARADALKVVGGFDPRYFLYMEDADLTREMKAKGVTLYHPGFSVTHVWSRDSAHSLKSTLMHVKSMMQYFCKWGFRL